MITTDSRYQTAVIQTSVGADGQPLQEMRPAFPRARVVNFTYYRTDSGDRIDTIAHEFYGNGRLWWMIADANPEILNWLDLEPGSVIRVPNG